MTAQILTQKLVKELFDYQDGKLFWKVKLARSTIIGTEAGCINSQGYRVIGINGKHYYSHRLIFLYHKGYLPDFIDHIKGSSDRIENLREATLVQNSANATIRKDNKSGVKGISWYKRDRKWRAEINCNGKPISLGCFDDIEVAEQVVRIERIRLHGEFANHGCA